MKEFDIIKKYFLPLTNNSKAARNLQDDAAIIKIGLKKELVVSKDLSVQDVHFKEEYGASLIAQKLLISNLSDLAASGAKPLYYLLGFSNNLAKNDRIDEKFIGDFCKGLKKIGDKFKIDLIGGDSVKTTNNLCFSVTIFGETPLGKSLKRSEAKDGDLIFVSGNIGDSFLGLQILQNKISCKNKPDKKYLTDRHLLPTAQIELGIELIKNNVKCAIDVSDGLLADLNHICETSFLDATIFEDLIPISKAAKSCLKENKNITLNQLLSGGEDYELIFTAPKRMEGKILKLAEKLNIKITKIGHLQKVKSGVKLGAKIHLFDKAKKEIHLKELGWQHY